MSSKNPNPWENNRRESEFVLGDPEFILILARRHGLLHQKKLNFSSSPNSSAEVNKNTSDTEPARGNQYFKLTKVGEECANIGSRSLKLISILQELSQLKDSLNHVEHDILCRMLDKESADLLHVDVLDSRRRQLEHLTKHFSDIAQSTDRIIAQLQKVSVDTSLKIEARYHRHFCECLSILTSLLNNLSEDCKDIESLRSIPIKSDPVKLNSLSSTVQLLVDCKIAVQRLHDHGKARGN